MATPRQANLPQGSRGGPVVVRVPLTAEQTAKVMCLTGKHVTELKLTREQLKSLVDIAGYRCDGAS
jgi:hypothetical protein